MAPSFSIAKNNPAKYVQTKTQVKKTLENKHEQVAAKRFVC